MVIVVEVERLRVFDDESKEWQRYPEESCLVPRVVSETVHLVSNLQVKP